jgi:tetratricopeptide (TPR) repeat protein
MSEPTSRPPLPGSYEDLLLQARGLQESGQIAQAIEQYYYLIDKLSRLSVKILDRRPELRNLRKQAIAEVISLLRWERRLAEAVQQQQTLLDLDPERSALWRRELATLRVEKGEVEAGMAELRALAEEAPDDPWSWLALGHEARLEGRFAESQAALERALAAARATPDSTDALATAHYERFRLLKELSRWEEAVAAWEQAIALEPRAVDGTVPQVYKMLTDAGLYGMARTYVSRDPNPIRAGYQRGLLDYMTGRPADAVQAWQEVAALNPADHPGGEEAWMEAVLQLKQPERVTERAEELTAAYPTPRALALGGIAWAAQGELETARALLEQAVFAQRRERPPKQKLDSAEWRLLDSVVEDSRIKTALRPFFAVIETTWGLATR